MDLLRIVVAVEIEDEDSPIIAWVTKLAVTIEVSLIDLPSLI